jgi:hypothetical protein
MHSPPKPQAVDLSTNASRSIQMSIWRIRDLIVLLGFSVTACSNGVDPGSIEQLIRIALH